MLILKTGKTMVHDEDVFRVLRSFNPWWTTGKVPNHLTPPVRRSAYYTLRARLDQPQWRRGFLLEGPRRVGKTTLMYQLAADVLAQGRFHPRRILYVSFDHPLIKLARFDQVLRQFQEMAAFLPSEGYDSAAALLLLDEIQYTDDWAAWLKWLIDQHPHFRVVATGSASARLRLEGADPSVGRWISLSVPPLSFLEFAALRGLPLPSLEGFSQDMLWGGAFSTGHRSGNLLKTAVPLSLIFTGISC